MVLFFYVVHRAQLGEAQLGEAQWSPGVPLCNSAPSPRALRGELTEHRLEYSLVKQPVPKQTWIVWQVEGRAEVREVGKGGTLAGICICLAHR